MKSEKVIKEHCMHHIQLLKRYNMKPLQSLSGRHAKLLCKMMDDAIIMKVRCYVCVIIKCEELLKVTPTSKKQTKWKIFFSNF